MPSSPSISAAAVAAAAAAPTSLFPFLPDVVPKYHNYNYKLCRAAVSPMRTHASVRKHRI